MKIKTEFLISNIPAGKLNAMVKNIMIQTGITEPEEAVRMINAGEVKISVVKCKWVEEDGVIYFSITSDGTTGEEWISLSKIDGHRLSDSAKTVLLSEDFKTTNGITYEVAVLKGELFSDSNRITKTIRKEAKKRKFSTPNTEIACLIREKFSNKELEAMGLYWIVAMHEPIKVDGDPLLLCVIRNDDGSRLATLYDTPGRKWGRAYGFAFVMSQVSGF